MRRHNLFLPDDLVEEARKLAEKRNQPLAAVVRTALEKYIQAVKNAEAARMADIKSILSRPHL